MPIDTKHPEYTKLAPAWRMMRDLAGGQRKIHEGRTLYLPALTEEPQASYDARLARTPFYNATWRTIEALVGMLFRKAPEIECAPGTVSLLADVTKSGMPFELFADAVATEYETVGKVGILTDYPQVPNAGAPNLTKKVAEANNLTPNLAQYPAESIINWRHEWIGGRSQLAMVVLQEEAPKPGRDKYAHDTVPQWRELELVQVDGALAYRVTVWQKGQDKLDKIVSGPIFPTMDGATLSEIPFEIIGDGLPPLEDMGHINVSHFQSTADLEHGAHMTALPQPWATGIQPEFDPVTGQKIVQQFHIGGGNLWTFADANSQVGMLEYSGQGLGALENRLASKEQQMAVLGARMLEQQKRGVESGEAAGIHRSGEQSSLQAQSARLSHGFSRVLSWFEQWAGGPGGVVVNLNRDFVPVNLSAQDVTALVAAWQAGAISKEALFLKFQKGGVVGDGTDFETEEEKISNAPPALPAATAPGSDKSAPLAQE